VIFSVENEVATQHYSLFLRLKQRIECLALTVILHFQLYNQTQKTHK